MEKNLIVSSSDDKYSSLLVELYKSVAKTNNYDFAILDCGISQNIINYFKEKNIQIKKPNWEFEIPNYKIRGRDYLKAQFSRFYLDTYFPGYENYIWMDSDTWINCKNTFEYYIQGASEKGFAICPQVDRSSPKLININWLWNYP